MDSEVASDITVHLRTFGTKTKKKNLKNPSAGWKKSNMGQNRIFGVLSRGFGEIVEPEGGFVARQKLVLY